MIGNITRLVKFLNNLNYTPTTISRNHSYYFNIKGTIPIWDTYLIDQVVKTGMGLSIISIGNPCFI